MNLGNIELARDYQARAAEHREQSKTCRVLGDRRKADWHDKQADYYLALAVEVA